MYSIKTKGLSFQYPNGQRALNEVHLAVPEGSIFGFLGPNGAGKTTTIRLLTGLLSPDCGEISILGSALSTNRKDILRKIGTLIETPSLYAHLTARENLNIYRLFFQCQAHRIDHVLQLVGLSGTGNKKVSQFSLGMKQRLGIAQALLHDPELLILDEPSNGLDPTGIIEIRELLLDLNRKEGKTILLSSHLLAEIQKLVSDVGIIHQGNLIFQGSAEDLLRQRERSGTLCIATSDPPRAKEIIERTGTKCEGLAGVLRIPALVPSETGSVVRLLVESGIDVYEVCPEKENLESIFIDMVK